MYSKKVIKHFQHPHNYGKMTNADAIGKVGNIICGDVMWLYLKINNDKIVDVKFETFGCVSAIATSSFITDLAINKTIPQALAITKDQIIKGLDGLPPIKIHCSVLAVDALQEAVFDYYTKTKQPIPVSLQEAHDRIAKDRDTIQCRYHDWAETEEHLHSTSKSKK